MAGRERPLRLKVDLSMDRVEEFFDACIEAKEVSLGDVIYDLSDELRWGPHLDYNRFVDAAMRVRELKMTAKRKRLLRTALTERDEGAMPVVKRVNRGHVPAE